jgi:hypothetical protein
MVKSTGTGCFIRHFFVQSHASSINFEDVYSYTKNPRIKMENNKLSTRFKRLTCHRGYQEAEESFNAMYLLGRNEFGIATLLFRLIFRGWNDLLVRPLRRNED